MRVCGPRLDRLLEGIQVHAHQIDGAKALGVEGGHVVCDIAPRQDGAMHGRVEGLDSAPHHFGEPAQLLDADDVDPGLFEVGRRSTGRDDLDAELAQGACKADEVPLVADGDQRPANGLHGSEELGVRSEGLGVFVVG